MQIGIRNNNIVDEDEQNGWRVREKKCILKMGGGGANFEITYLLHCICIDDCEFEETSLDLSCTLSWMLLIRLESIKQTKRRKSRENLKGRTKIKSIANEFLFLHTHTHFSFVFRFTIFILQS